MLSALDNWGLIGWRLNWPVADNATSCNGPVMIAGS